MIIPFHTTNAPDAIGPYSQAVMTAGNMLFVSGQLGFDPQTMQIVEGGVEPQTEQAVTNMLMIVEDAGFTRQNIAKVTIYIKNMDDFAAINKIYADKMAGHRPARAVVEVARLPKDALVEIDCICCK